ncbi:MAG: hypothetical protein H6728_08905 [Myxococcales bacterium]|nr:hypothetical protein [Myxococcales bacterium]
MEKKEDRLWWGVSIADVFEVTDNPAALESPEKALEAQPDKAVLESMLEEEFVSVNLFVEKLQAWHLKELLKALPQVQSLCISYKKHAEPGVLTLLSEYPNLNSLSLPDSKLKLRVEDIEELAVLSNLEELSLDKLESEDCLAPLIQSHHIEMLSVLETKDSVSFLQALTKLTWLQKLSLNLKRPIPREGWEILGKLSQLTELSIINKTKSNLFAEWQDASWLHSLHHLKKLGWVDAKFSVQHLQEIVGASPHLTSLSFEECHFRPGALEQCAQLKTLENFELVECQYPKGANWNFLERMRGLEHANFAGEDLPKGLASTISRMRGLRSLEILSFDLEPEDYEILEGLKDRLELDLIPDSPAFSHLEKEITAFTDYVNELSERVDKLSNRTPTLRERVLPYLIFWLIVGGFMLLMWLL